MKGAENRRSHTYRAHGGAKRHQPASASKPAEASPTAPALPFIALPFAAPDPPMANQASKKAPTWFRILLGACVRRQVVDVVYLARTRELAVSFSPHTLVVAPHRSHFRGYSIFEFDGESHHWDLVPSRVVSAEVRPTLGYVGDEHDADWHAEEMLRLRLKDDLPNAMQQAIRYEYGLLTDQLEIGPVRKALLHYVRAGYLKRRYEGFAGAAWDIVSGL